MIRGLKGRKGFRPAFLQNPGFNLRPDDKGTESDKMVKEAIEAGKFQPKTR